MFKNELNYLNWNAILFTTYVGNGGAKMARPSKCRRICHEPSYDRFVPNGILSEEQVMLTVDEYEVIRLIDLEKKTHEQCALQMNISRTTVTEMYDRARYKMADSMVNGKALCITGGNYQLCDGTARHYCGKPCKRMDLTAIVPIIKEKGANIMRVAVTYENGNVFQHFGHTETFKIFDIENNKVISSQVVPTMGSGHGALAGFLAENSVDVLICGGIGGGAQTALANAGIKLYGGVSGNADEAVNALIAGNLGYNPNVHCNHHDHEHGEGQHQCGEHGCH